MTDSPIDPRAVVLVAIVFASLACDQKAPPEAAPVRSVSDPEASPHVHHPAEPAEQRGTEADHGAHAAHALPLDAPLSKTSIYHLDTSLVDQHGRAFGLHSLRGHPVLMTMFYASCRSICPMLITQLQRTDAKLPPDVRATTQFVLISLDPARDSLANLQKLAKTHDITDPRWHILRASESDVREIAAVLGVRYRSLPDGEISHSPLITLLDGEGAIDTRVEATGSELDALVAATQRTAAGLK